MEEGNITAEGNDLHKNCHSADILENVPTFLSKTYEILEVHHLQPRTKTTVTSSAGLGMGKASLSRRSRTSLRRSYLFTSDIATTAPL